MPWHDTDPDVMSRARDLAAAAGYDPDERADCGRPVWAAFKRAAESAAPAMN